MRSVLGGTDRNRLLVVTVVMDGCKADGAFESELRDMDSGAVPHFHGLFSHVHRGGGKGEGEDKEEDHDHGEKVQVIWNDAPMGVGASRRDGAEFIRILVNKHEGAGYKDPDEDVLLLLLRPGGVLEGPNDDGLTKSWLDAVTPALILPRGLEPEEFSAPNETHAGDAVPHTTKLANAVSLTLDSIGTPINPNLIVRVSPGSTISVSNTLDRLRPAMASSDELTPTEGGNESYPTPVVMGGAAAMRLDTFLNLPATDDGLLHYSSADLELSLNLWLCGDGVDVLTGARVAIPPVMSGEAARALPPQEVRRMQAMWLGETETRKRCRWFESYADAFGLKIPSGSESEDEEEKGVSGAGAGAGAGARKSETPKGDGGQEPGQGGNMQPHMTDHRDLGMRKPATPLSQTNLAIVAQAKSIKTDYVPIPNGLEADHPHRGAKDDKGEWGYVLDAEALRKASPAFPSPGAKSSHCTGDESDRVMLTEKVFVDTAGHEIAERAHQKRVRIMCIVYTIEKNHDRIPAIRETWGQRCDGFMVVSTETDVELGTVEIPHEGPEEYNNIWQKVRSTWSYVYDHYYDKYDYFHIGGDDMYILVENLRLYLESEEIQTAQNGGTFLPRDGPAMGDDGVSTPLFLGRRFNGANEIFNSGGSGYTLNRAALKTLVALSMPTCMPHFESFSEDTMVARCLLKSGVVPYDTKDDKGGERYMPFSPGHHLNYLPPDDVNKDWYAKYSIDVKWGLDHCAAKSVAFHYAKPELMRNMHAILYGYCDA